MKIKTQKLKRLLMVLVLIMSIIQGCSSKKECSKCDGTGQMKHSECNGKGSLIGGYAKCFPCGGSGKLKCDLCDGTGQVEK